jgi:hypothetical protein
VPKGAGCVFEVAELLPCKNEALSSNLSATSSKQSETKMPQENLPLILKKSIDHDLFWRRLEILNNFRIRKRYLCILKCLGN